MGFGQKNFSLSREDAKERDCPLATGAVRKEFLAKPRRRKGRGIILGHGGGLGQNLAPVQLAVHLGHALGQADFSLPAQTG